MTRTSWPMVLADSMRRVVLLTFQASALLAAHPAADPHAAFGRSWMEGLFRSRLAHDRLLGARRMPLQLGPARTRELRLLPAAAASLRRD